MLASALTVGAWATGGRGQGHAMIGRHRRWVSLAARLARSPRCPGWEANCGAPACGAW